MNTRPLIAALVSLNVLVWGALVAFEVVVAGTVTATSTIAPSDLLGSVR